MESNTSTTTTTNEIQMAQQITDTFGMTPEQEEEIKLRSKYPNPQKPGGSTFIQKMLYKGVCYFNLIKCIIHSYILRVIILLFIFTRTKSILTLVITTWPNREKRHL